MTKLPTKFEDFLDQRDFIILGGGFGTELQRRGYKTTLPLWSAQANLDAQDLVVEIHSDYFKAGSDICVTNTFRTTPRTFKKLGREDEAREAMKLSVSLAQKAQKSVDRPTFCAGSFAPLEDCYRPDLVPSKTELEHEHGQLAEWLKEDSVDFLLAETINEKTEAITMANAASNTGLPFMISFVVDKNGKLLDGTDLMDVVNATNLPGRIAVGLNCREIDLIDRSFDLLKDNYDGEIALYPNGFGHPHDDEGWIFDENDDSVDKFVTQALNWNQSGTKIIGGCCGTTPAYIQALSSAYQGKIAA